MNVRYWAADLELGDPDDMDDAEFHELLAVDFGITGLAARVTP